jgi:hypothetical protein
MQPRLLFHDQLLGNAPSWQAYGESFTEAEHRVVPAEPGELERLTREIRLLVLQQPAYHCDVDVDLGRRAAVMFSWWQ